MFDGIRRVLLFLKALDVNTEVQPGNRAEPLGVPSPRPTLFPMPPPSTALRAGPQAQQSLYPPPSALLPPPKKETIPMDYSKQEAGFSTHWKTGNASKGLKSF